jgi:hypothetical protein
MSRFRRDAYECRAVAETLFRLFLDHLRTLGPGELRNEVSTALKFASYGYSREILKAQIAQLQSRWQPLDLDAGDKVACAVLVLSKRAASPS